MPYGSRLPSSLSSAHFLPSFTMQPLPHPVKLPSTSGFLDVLLPHLKYYTPTPSQFMGNPFFSNSDLTPSDPPTQRGLALLLSLLTVGILP